MDGEAYAPILKIGITGSAGSGKSMVRKAFGRLGLKTLDCDRIAREVVAPGEKGYEGVVDLFGPEVVLPDRTLDRAGLRNLMVDRPHLRKKLENLLHPLILDALFHQVDAGVYDRERACACEVPLLFELGMENRFHSVVAVTADEQCLAERIAARDQVTKADARKILALQMGQEEKIKKADHVIYNNGSFEVLFETVEKCYGMIKKEFLTKK